MVKSEVLARIPSEDLRVYLVWLPILGGDTLDAARESAGTVGDPRVTHYWDPDLSFARSLGEVLSIPPSPRRDQGLRTGTAWDIYVAYPRGATWEQAPPTTFWMQQLSQVDAAQAPKLDGPALRAHIESRLAPTDAPR